MGNYSITNMPVGLIIPVINSDNVPLGTLECNGALISKTTYAKLWSGTNMSIGSQYGESGGFFRLPDFRGRMPRHISGSSGRDPDAATRYADQPGAPTGNEVGSMQDDVAAGAHVHKTKDHIGVGAGLHERVFDAAGNPFSLAANYTFFGQSGIVTGVTGGNGTGSNQDWYTDQGIGAGEGRSKNFNLKWCIKY